MTQAQHAIRAARNWKSWGRFSTLAYLNNNGVPHRLYYLARTLEASKGVHHE